MEDSSHQPTDVEAGDGGGNHESSLPQGETQIKIEQQESTPPDESKAASATDLPTEPEKTSNGDSTPATKCEPKNDVINEVDESNPSNEDADTKLKMEQDPTVTKSEPDEETAEEKTQETKPKVEPNEDTPMTEAEQPESKEDDQKSDIIPKEEGEQQVSPPQPSSVDPSTPEPLAMEEETTENDTKKDFNIGKTVEANKVMPSGQLFPLQGKVVNYQEPSGRLPPRWTVHWESAENVILADEWLAADLQPETYPEGNSKFALDAVQDRYQHHLEHELGSNQIITTLLMLAAMEEALQTNLHNNNVAQDGSVIAGSRGLDPHPPLYYSNNPSGYLKPPTATDTTPTLTARKVHMTPASLAQRVRSGCQWAWKYWCAQQPVPPPSLLATTPSNSTQRRSLRQTRGPALPEMQYPTPVGMGGRVAMWWLQQLEQEQESAQSKPTPNSPQQDAKEGSSRKSPNKGAKTTPEATNTDDDAMEEEDEESGNKMDDDEDYSTKDGEDDDDDELEDVEKEREKLSPVADEEAEQGEEEEEEDEEHIEHMIQLENPYLKPSFPAFLEYLARPKALSGEAVQTALCDAVLRIKFNKRSSAFGLPTTDLETMDLLVLDQETPDYPPGKIVLKNMSEDSFGDLQKMETQAFSRCKFTLDVIGDQESSMQVQRKQELIQQELQFKERKTWDKWRHRGIHEGYATWPSWHDAVAKWLSTINGGVEAPAIAPEEPKTEETKAENDEALAKSLEETEVATGRRRTARRTATSASEGVFYGNQSQLTQKQLMDALVRLVKTNQYQTLLRLQGLVADDSSDPLRRSRVALGKLVWKRNQIVRKSVMAALSDEAALARIANGPLIKIEHAEVDPETGTKQETKEPSEDETTLMQYVKQLHSTELRLRQLLVKHFADIPVAIVAAAADERPGSMEAMDTIDFDEDPDSIEWHTSGHDLLQRVIFRPADWRGVSTDMTPCYWYEIQEYSKSIASEADDREEPDSKERRMRFRAVPIPAPGESYVEQKEHLILTEAQVHAGIKAGEMEKKNKATTASDGNPFSGASGDKISLIPVDMDEEDGEAPVSEIHGKIVGYDNVLVDGEDDEVEYRILVLPQNHPTLEEAFWASLDIRADTSSYVCQPLGDSNTWYSIEQFDYHQSSAAFQQCLAVLNYLRRNNKAGPFMEPVDPVALNIPSYPKIVKNPMDVSTIADKLENGHYSSILPGQTTGISPVSKMLNGPFRADVELMFDNATLFNPPDDWIYQAAAQLKKSTLKKISDLSIAADQKLSGAGRFRQKKSVYMDEDSDVDLYEYESDADDDYDGGGRKVRKRKRGGRSGGTQKDESAARAIEYSVRLQNTLRDATDLRGPFANLPINLVGSSFSLSAEWSCRPSATTTGSNGTPQEQDEEEDAAAANKKRAQEMAELLAMQKVMEQNEAAGLRRSTRAHHTPTESGSSGRSGKDAVEYFMKGRSSMEEAEKLSWPRNRVEVEIHNEKRHENFYAKLFMESSKWTVAHGDDSLGVYSMDSFPPYLGRVVALSNWDEVSWEIRAPFVVPAIRWVLRGLIQSGHLTAMEELTADPSSGVIMTNDVYYWDSSLQPFEVLDLRELQRKKRANKSGEEESEDDVELSEYERARAERVARNAERLKALGLA